MEKVFVIFWSYTYRYWEKEFVCIHKTREAAEAKAKKLTEHANSNTEVRYFVEEEEVYP